MKYLLSLLLLFSAISVQAADLRIAAATNLRYVLPELVTEFEQQTGLKAEVSYAASGILTTQIMHGAPFDIFLSANVDYIKRLIDQQFTQGKPLEYAQAQLALYATHRSGLTLDVDLEGIKSALKAGTLNKVTIANPKHAPYGQAAQTALEQAGLWQAIQPYLLIAENASQAVQFSMASTVDVGFVPYAHVIQNKLKEKGRFIVLKQRLPQQAVKINHSPQAASQFMTFLNTKATKMTLIRHGFIVDIDSDD
ncbi:MAG: molybdate ABC transporter substrate-binding protein [Gammaproteobacteria bacterium]|nr:MAG: molybdate ABC transporter substrate-binding protein [Gammaproteobacteria bacterium]